MASEQNAIRAVVLLVCLLPGAVAACVAQTGPEQRSAAPAQEQFPALAQLVDHALANELRAAQDASHPMRYLLRKSSPRLTTAKEIIETRDGAVARLVAINDQPLSAADAQKEQDRLNALLADPDLQRHRRHSEQTDTGRALKVLRALPQAFLYQHIGSADTATGRMEKFSFRPNPAFNPPDLETEVLTAMSGEIWIDTAHARVTQLEGHLDQDVGFGWGILGLLHKGGWIVIEQANVGMGQWRTVRFQMQMSARVFLSTRSFDMTEDESQFSSVPAGMSYVQGIEMLLAEPAPAHP
ncbi:MAG TPA: hypothetical protein VHX20_09190 [Terracidiphilus sp.]|jgi:hypothetical protein|nr:hypothetical protein [Terracidiphilus sp.]